MFIQYYTVPLNNVTFNNQYYQEWTYNLPL